MKKIIPLCLLIAVLCFAAIFFWQKYARLDGVLRFAVSAEISSLDPALAFDDSSLTAIGQTYETLYEYHYLKRPYELVPLLAQAMPEISSDGKTVTITLKKGILYHPHPALRGTREVQAADFINQIKRLLSPQMESAGANFFQDILIGAKDFQQQMNAHPERIWDIPLSGVLAPDPYTLVFKLTQSVPYFTNLLAMTFVTPVPLEVLKAENNQLKNVMVGTGPYVLQKKEADALHFQSFSSYHQIFYPNQGDRISHLENWLEDGGKKLPFMKEAILQVIPEDALRWKMFTEGKLDWTDVSEKVIGQVISPSGGLESEWAKKGYDLQIYPRYSGRWLAFNMHDHLWGKKLQLRQAVAFAIDREHYIKEMTGQTALLANSLYFPGVRGYGPNKDLPFTYNLERARELLKKAGHENGQGLPPLIYTTRGKSEGAMAEAKLVQEMLAKIGIKVDIHQLTFPEFLTQGRQGKLSFFTDGWIMDYPDPSNMLQLLLKKNHPGINKSGHDNPQFERIYERYLALKNEELAGEKGLALLNEMEKTVMEELPWIMLYIHRGHIISQGQIKNLRSSTFIRNYLKYIKKN